MSSFDTPPQPAPERPSTPDANARAERFLEREGLQTEILGSLSKVFALVDALPEKARKQAAKDFEEQFARSGDHEKNSPEAVRVLRIQETYGPNVLENVLRAGDSERQLTTEERSHVDTYKEFLSLFDEKKDLRPKLLAKLAPMNPEEAPWEQRQAFTRFLTEFYGHEKKAEGQQELFLSLDGQVDLTQAWSIKGNWGFSEKDFKEIRAQLPDVKALMMNYENEPLVAPVLVPYLQDEYSTFSELRTLLTVPQEKNFVNPVYNTPTKDNLKLLEGIKHKHGLAFEITDLGDNKGEKPDDVRSKNKNVSGAGVLAAAALNPEWVQAMGGDKVPFAWAAGYEVTVPGDGESWRHVPHVYFHRDVREVYLRAPWRDIRHSHYSVPSSRE